MKDRGAVYAGLSESQTYRSDTELSDAKWRWEAGTEGKPSEKGASPSRGMGAFIDTTVVEASLVRTDKYAVWHRIELEGGVALVVGVGYFPNAQDIKGHERANVDLREALAYFNSQGVHVVFGGDLNAHTGANGDTSPVDAAGRMILESARLSDMVVVNTMPGVCVGGPSRRQVREDGTQESTVDYVLCSTSMTDMVDRMVIEEGQMGSDHRPLVLYLRGLTAKKPKTATPREVWDVRAIPSPPADWSWVNACQKAFKDWIARTGDIVGATEAAGVDAARVGDLLEWSFQYALDKVAAEKLGTRKVGPRPTPIMDAAARLASQQLEVSRSIMVQVREDPGASSEVKADARKQFLAAGRRLTALAARRKQLAELSLFRDVEENQSDSKQFWGRFKKLRNSIHVAKSPPPVAVDASGETVTDPVHVLRVWRDFSAGIASADLSDTREEGKYDDEYKKEVEDRLAWLRGLRKYQDDLDRPITATEVFMAIRKLKMGKAPGEDGVLTDILKTAADAVNNSRLRGNNTVVDALVLLFNYVFDNEVWPERWGTGVIFPLHKHDSRLEPSNYRPITLLSVIGKLFGVVVNARLSRFSEATDSISDEQGGFRPRRGTPDQVFLLREVLASRKERGISTYVTYIDVRKAYDTVWREDAYVRIYDSGIQGKLWRQLQAMHTGLSRRVMHPLGYTDWFAVERGVAQGAVESPWIYANFIDGLARALRAAGLGVMVAGRRVPILLYADDMVMLASSQPELARMNAVASEFARKHRFQFNGEKSAVMAFNTTPVAMDRVKSTKWELFGDPVEVKDSYVYLGTITPANGTGWKDHVAKAIEKAKRRSADLLWVCRADKGIRSRTAVVLWQSIVRPLLEYASELWSGQVTSTEMKDIESVQTTFLRGTLGLHANGSGVSDDVLRAEAGCERIQDRWAKLTMGYWRRIFAAKPGRLLRVVAEFRHGEYVASAGAGFGSRGWMPSAKQTLTVAGLDYYWQNTAAAPDEGVGGWSDLVYEAVDRHSNTSRQSRMTGMSSTGTYMHIKSWGLNPEPYSFSAGECERIGQHVPERYLDDRKCLKGTRLKLLCRLNCLPLMDRVGREVKPRWPKENRICFACLSLKEKAVVEDVHHFIMECSSYSDKRERLLCSVRSIIDGSAGELIAGEFQAMDSTSQAHILLGKRFGDPIAENSIDRLVKRFLTKAWNIRSGLTDKVNTVLSTSYDVFTAKAG